MNYSNVSGGIFGSGGLLGLLVAVIVLAAFWRIFSKAGEAGWKALIPIYNIIVLLKIVGRSWWWILVLWIPIVGWVMLVIVLYDLSKAFGHGVPFTIGLLVLPFIFYLILGFGGDEYRGPAIG